jgi:long-chain acyl-CoA synthetase
MSEDDEAKHDADAPRADAGHDRPAWLSSYPPGIPATVDTEAHASIDAIFRASVEAYADRPAFSNLGATLTYAETDRLATAFAAWLQQDAALVPGDRIAIMLPNLLQYPVALFGALRAGLVVVNTNPLYTVRELRHQLADSGARAIVILENFGHVLEQCIDDTQVEMVVIARMGDMLGRARGALVNAVVKYLKHLVPAHALQGTVAFNAALARGRSLELAPPSIALGDLALLQYTGGTTGVSKGSMLSHHNIVANVAQASAWLAPVFQPGREVVITALPLYHIFALTANCFTFVAGGGHNVLVTNPRDLRGFVKTLAATRFTAITGVNTLFNALLSTPGFSSVDFSTLKLALGGGMAVQRSVAERWKAVTGCTLVEAYGLTETSPAVCINPLDVDQYTGSIGLPIPSTEVAIRDDEGRFLGIGAPGELWVRGPQVMEGYWQREDETARTIDADGWLRTGDVATIDERGFVRIVDRKKDMILVSGFNVYPNEVEEVVAAHPGVLEVGAIGVPDTRSGEAVRLVVAKRDPGLTEEALRTHCERHLARYKCPRSIVFTDELPKSNVGKILRRALRDRFGA